MFWKNKRLGSVFYKAKEKSFPYLLLIPALVVLFSIIIYPIIYVICLSFFRWNWAIPTIGIQWVGLGNFKKLMGNRLFWNSLKNTVYYMGVDVGLQLCIGLGLALLLDKPFRGRTVIRTIFMIPFFIIPVVAAILWRMMYHPRMGILNYLLSDVLRVIPKDFKWLADPSQAINLIIFADIWRITPFVFLVMVAGLQTIPQQLCEAAEIDGANKVQVFLYVTLPWLKPIILFVLFIRLTDVVMVFDLPYILTGGGPSAATEVLGLTVYNQAFSLFEFGYASSTAVVILLLSLGLIVSLHSTLSTEKVT